MLRLVPLVVASAILAAPAAADIVWTGAVSSDIFDEANWDLSGSTVTVVAPNVTIADNVVIANAPGLVEIPEIAGGQFRFQVGDGFTLTIDGSTVRATGNDGVGGVPGTSVGITVKVANGASFEPYFVVNQVLVDIDATSGVVFGGPGNPVNLSFVDTTFGATLEFLLEDPVEFTNEHLNKVTVDGQPAIIGTNLEVVASGTMGSLVTVPPGTVGSNYCSAASNSTGVGAALSISGSAVVSANNVRLECHDMPAGSFAFFLTSRTQGFVSNPGGSVGDLCLGGAIGRFVGPGQIQNSGAAGAVTLQADLTAHPTPTGLVAVAPGETWNFQCWYRDTDPSGSAVSNFSDGRQVAFL